MPIYYKLKSCCLNKSGGFTLLELLISLAIAAILLMGSTYFVQQWLTRTRARAWVQQWVVVMQHARLAAGQLGKVITVCPNDGNQQCGVNWREGQLLFIDNNVNAQVDQGDVLLRVFSALPRQVDLSWQGFRSDDWLQFSPNIYSQTANGRFLYKTENVHSEIILNRLGRVKVERS